MKPLLAHSARPEQDISAQSYSGHINGVMGRAEMNVQNAARFMCDERKDLFLNTVRAAACLHDLGKLDEKNQSVLRGNMRKPLPINHVDAGVAKLLSLNRMESAFLVASHHIGLNSIPDECAKPKQLFLRDHIIADFINKNLVSYENLHNEQTDQIPESIELSPAKWSGLTRRIMLSCLVDADHGDTARHYLNESEPEPPLPRWSERIRALDNYVDSLFRKDPASSRNKLRHEIYHACRDAVIDDPMVACDSPVGTGKTTAVMAYLLQEAKRFNLRHVFVVLPFTNIINQSVNTYRKALVLPGENPEHIVAAHHHQADFENVDSRMLATLWSAPIIVTTAVQFFETLGSNHPAKLRKLHELAGSAVFIDETHASIPSYIWPQTWRWLEKLSHKWNCRFVFASGSLPRFWRLPQFVEPPVKIPDLVPRHLRQRAADMESTRLIFRRYGKTEKPLNCQTLIQFILSKKGPRLVIVNTVQSAAVIADNLQGLGKEVFHLSTVLTPRDRECIVQRIFNRLIAEESSDWTLVATSCVEAGMDFSFRTAFRESSSTASLIQTGGRVNRHSMNSISEVWDFRVLDPFINKHPAFDVSRQILDRLFDEQLINSIPPDELVTEAMRREIMSSFDSRSADLKRHEETCNYPVVADLCRVINSDTRTVVVSQNVINALEGHEKVDSMDIQKNSVQMWPQKIHALGINPIRGCEELYKWTGPYDAEFLGCMKGILPRVYAIQAGLII